MSEVELTIRVTGIRSQNPVGYGGCIFTGVIVDRSGTVVDAAAYVVVRAPGSVIRAVRVDRGQWWTVKGPMHSRQTVVDGFAMREHQVEAEVATLARPSGEQVVRFLADNPAFEGIGAVKARKLWDSFGPELYKHLDSANASQLSTVLAPELATRLVDAWSVHGQSSVLQWLQTRGIGAAVGKKLLAFYGSDAQTKIEENPYRLLSFAGSWRKVDELARTELGIARDDSRRLVGAVEEACYRMFNSGHTTMLSAQLADKLGPMLGKPPPGTLWRDQVSRALTAGLQNGTFVRAHHGVQPLGAAVMERQIADAVAKRLAKGFVPLLPRSDIEQLLDLVQAEDDIRLNEEQRAALDTAVGYEFVCITGGAGVGKTTVLKALYRLLDHAHVRVIQLALAGRAAKRMTEATGRPASTIAGFMKNLRDDSLDGPTAIVVDESSMVDVISMSQLCARLPDHVRLVLVGDPHQLMPVGPGLVLHVLSRAAGVPVVELKTVKRYGGSIATAASDIRGGRWPDLGEDETAEVAFLPCPPQLIGATVTELLNLDREGSQVLCAVRNSQAGTKAINALCQERFTAGATEVTVWNEEFEQYVRVGLRCGDPVLCTRNMWPLGLQNGSLGVISEVEAPPRVIRGDDGEVVASVLAWVEWDDGERRPLTAEMLENLEFGYAITVHKAQGSQWRRIIVPISSSRLLDRTLLYTAVTRAQKQVLLVGDIDAAKAAVKAPPRATERNVGLDLHLARLRKHQD